MVRFPWIWRLSGECRIKYVAATILICMGTSWPAAAEMKSLDSYLSQPSEQIEPSYMLVRCASLFASMLMYIGEERMGSERYLTTKQNGDRLMKLATAVRIKKSGPGASDGVLRDVSNVADIYLERMNKNYAANGKAFGEDPLILSDLKTCKVVSESFQ